MNSYVEVHCLCDRGGPRTFHYRSCPGRPARGRYLEAQRRKGALHAHPATDPANDEAGTALPSADCASGLEVIGRWRETPLGLELLAPGGGMVARLKDRNGSFEGSRLTDGKALALDR